MRELGGREWPRGATAIVENLDLDLGLLSTERQPHPAVAAPACFIVFVSASCTSR
jgi:hypothetical protein